MEIGVCSLLCEVELGVLYPSSVEVIGCCLATGLPLGCEAVFERGVRYSLCCNKSSSVEVPSEGDSGLEILLGEGGDVELGARTSKHILS